MKNNQIVQRCDFRMHDIIDGKYRVERVLGSSQREQKFKVIDPMGKEYVLKLLKLWEIEPRLRQQILVSSDSEIKSCLIKSSYLTHIAGTGQVYGNPYLLIEYYQATDLSQYIGNHRLDLIKVAKQVLYGLRDLHKSGKVHCHLTPENILVTDDDDIMLTNYVTLGGRSSMFVSQKSESRVRFIDKSLAYRAPELFHADKCSAILPSVDVFSFGVVLFQLLTGTLPFGRLVTETDWFHYQTRVRSNDWNRNLLQRNDNREVWMSVFDMCFAVNGQDRAKNIDEILSVLPEDETFYKAVHDSKIEAPTTIENGVLLRIMQGDEFNKLYRLNEILQQPRRLITVGRSDQSVFNLIALPEQISTISRRHCTLEWNDENDTWYLRDGQWDKNANNGWQCSLNGTYLNSEKVTEEGHPIVPGDIISIGDIKLRVEGY